MVIAAIAFGITFLMLFAVIPSILIVESGRRTERTFESAAKDIRAAIAALKITEQV